MMKNEFLLKLGKLAEALYRSGDSESKSESWTARRNFISGFADAGLTLALVSRDEIQDAIDHAHLVVYGEGRTERAERLSQMRDESGEMRWDIFEQPTFERKK